MDQYENDAADMLAGAYSENEGNEFNAACKVLAGVMKRRDEDVQDLIKELQYVNALSSSDKPEALLFQEWATKCGFNMEQDGDFGYFIDTHTQAARKGWRTALVAFALPNATAPAPLPSVVGAAAEPLLNEFERLLVNLFESSNDSQDEASDDVKKVLGAGAKLIKHLRAAAAASIGGGGAATNSGFGPATDGELYMLRMDLMAAQLRASSADTNYEIATVLKAENQKAIDKISGWLTSSAAASIPVVEQPATIIGTGEVFLLANELMLAACQAESESRWDTACNGLVKTVKEVVIKLTELSKRSSDETTA